MKICMIIIEKTGKNLFFMMATYILILYTLDNDDN